jgi:Ca2+-binding EF-hand superfamily protein
MTIDELSLEVEDEHRYFADVVSLGKGREIVLKEGERVFLRSLSKELQNYELFEMSLDRPEGDLDRQKLGACLEFLSSLDSSCGCDMELIASHFHEFTASDFDKLQFSVLYAVLSHPKLVIDTEDSLLEVILRHASQDLEYFPLLEFVRFEYLSDQGMTSAFDFMSNSFDFLTFPVWQRLGRRLALSVKPPPNADRFAKSSPKLDSAIISELPEAFSMFDRSEFRLLYRGTRDGFQANDFHRLCNGHSPTFTLVLSTNGYTFGGYTPVAWNSRGEYVEDSSLKSFLFTIKNPHNRPPRIFTQKQQANALYDHGGYGPGFGNGVDLVIANQSNSTTGSYSALGTGYNNDTGIAGNTVFTGAQNFTVKEIEVFEVKARG